MPDFLHISILFIPLPVLLLTFFLFSSTLHILLLVLVVSLLPSYSIIYYSYLFLSSYSSSCSCCLSPPILFCALPLSLIRMLRVQSLHEITDDGRKRKYTDTRGLVVGPVHNSFIGIIPLCLRNTQ
jgi:hypothetical protein